MVVWVWGGVVELPDCFPEPDAFWVALPSDALRLETDGFPIEMSSVESRMVDFFRRVGGGGEGEGGG